MDANTIDAGINLLNMKLTKDEKGQGGVKGMYSLLLPTTAGATMILISTTLRLRSRWQHKIHAIMAIQRIWVP